MPLQQLDAERDALRRVRHQPEPRSHGPRALGPRDEERKDVPRLLPQRGRVPVKLCPDCGRRLYPAPRGETCPLHGVRVQARSSIAVVA